MQCQAEAGQNLARMRGNCAVQAHQLLPRRAQICTTRKKENALAVEANLAVYKKCEAEVSSFSLVGSSPRLNREHSGHFLRPFEKTKTSGPLESQHNRVLRSSMLSLLSAGAVLLPLAANAAEAAPEGFFDLVFYTVESLGPLGPVAFIIAVSLTECIPLFPTQPLSLASGLLFGTQKGALCMLTGTSIAAFIAFTVARGVGRPLAERIIRHEMAESSGANGTDKQNVGPVQAKLLEVQDAIEQGTFWQQAAAVFVLPLTPVVPFSASNYVLGLSPLPLAPYLAGTISCMSLWSFIYASFGGASRALLRRGADPDALLNDLLAKAGNLTEEAGLAAAVVGGVAAASWGVMKLKMRFQGTQEQSPPEGTSLLLRGLSLFRQRELASKE